MTEELVETQFVALELNIDAAFPVAPPCLALAPWYKAALFLFSIFTEPFLELQSGLLVDQVISRLKTNWTSAQIIITSSLYHF